MPSNHRFLDAVFRPLARRTSTDATSVRRTDARAGCLICSPSTVKIRGLPDCEQSRVERCVAQMPGPDQLPAGPQDADIVQTRQDCLLGRDSTRRMVERNVGAFFSDGGHPAKIPRHTWSYTICCLGNGSKGLG